MANAEIQIEMVVMSRLDLERLIDIKFEQHKRDAEQATRDLANQYISRTRSDVAEIQAALQAILARISDQSKEIEVKIAGALSSSVRKASAVKAV